MAAPRSNRDPLARRKPPVDQQQREACLRRREIEQQVPVRVLARTATLLPLPQLAATSRLANLFGEPGGVGVAQRTPAGDHQGGCRLLARPAVEKAVGARSRSFSRTPQRHPRGSGSAPVATATRLRSRFARTGPVRPKGTDRAIALRETQLSMSSVVLGSGGVTASRICCRSCCHVPTMSVRRPGSAVVVLGR